MRFFSVTVMAMARVKFAVMVTDMATVFGCRFAHGYGNKVFAIHEILGCKFCWVGSNLNIIMKPFELTNPRPTQPNKK